jgi:hypothetical protein
VTDSAGRYLVVALPVAGYRIEARADGFKTQIIERVRVDVARTSVVDFQLEVGSPSEVVNVASDVAGIERSTISVGAVVNERTMQELL